MRRVVRGTVRAGLAAGLMAGCLAASCFGQAPEHAEPVKQASAILFAAFPPPGEKDDKGQPALATLDPVAFVVGGQFLSCYVHGPGAQEGSISKQVLGKLKDSYSPGHRYSLWWRGVQWGDAEAVSSCMDDELDLTGFFRLHPAIPNTDVPGDFAATVFTGASPVASHLAIRTKGNQEERSTFLQSALAVLADDRVHVKLTKLQTGTLWKTQLRSGHYALAGNVVAQFPSGKPRTYNSYRLMLVIEETDGVYVPVLKHLHKATVILEQGQELPKPGEEFDEQNETDKEVFFDNFPLFPREPDLARISHQVQ